MESVDKKSSKRTHRTVTRGELRCLIEDVYPSAGSLSKKDRTGNASQVKRGLLERSIPHKGRIRTTRIELEPTEAHELTALRQNIRDIIKDLRELKRVRRHLGCSKPFPFYFENAVYFIVNSVASDAAWKTKNYTDCKRLLPDHLCFGNSVEEDLRSALVAERTKTDEEETPEAPEPPCVPAPERVRVDKIIARAEKKSDQAERIAYLTRSLSRHATDFRLLLCLYEEQWLAKDDWTPTFAKILSLTPKTAEEWSIRGRALQHQFRMDDAMKAYQNALKLEPGRIDALLKTIDIHRYRGEREDALTALKKALTLIKDKKDRVPLLALYAVELQFNGQASQADRQLEEARASDPSSPDILLASAWRSFHAHDYGAAKALFRKLMRREDSPEWRSEAYEGLLRCAIDTDQHRQAVHYARKMLEGAPQNALLRGILSWSLFKIGNLNEAKVQAERAITDTSPRNPAHNTLGAVYFQQGDFIRAEVHFRRMIELDSKGDQAPWAWQNIGMIREEEGQLDRALEACRAGLELDPSRTGIRCNLAALHLSQGQLDESERQCRYVLDSPSPPEDRRRAHVLLAATLLNQRKLHEVLECASTAPPEIRGEPALLCCEACAKQLLGDLPGAISLYESVNWSDVHDLGIQVEYLRALSQERQYGKVVELGGKFLDLGSHHPFLDLVVGQAHRARGEYFKAIDHLKLATREMPEDGPTEREFCLACIEFGLYETVSGPDAIAFFSSLDRETPGSAAVRLGMAANYIRNQSYASADECLARAEGHSPSLAGFLRIRAFSDALTQVQEHSDGNKATSLLGPKLLAAAVLNMVISGSGEGSFRLETEHLKSAGDMEKLKLMEDALGLIRGRHLSQAIPPLIDLTARYPEPSLKRLLAVCLGRQGDCAAAVKLLEDCVRDDPDNLFGLTVLASFQETLGDTHAASAAYSEALSRAQQPFFKNACQLSILRLAEDEKGTARKTIDTIASIPEDREAVHRAAADLAQADSESEWAEGALVLTIACHRFPDEPDFRFRLGNIYGRMNMIGEWVDHWRKAVVLCDALDDGTDHPWLCEVKDWMASYEQWGS
jgi:tetratricopeptide (TPR) repeat protein